MVEMAIGVFLVFALLLGVLILVTSETSEEDGVFSASPYRTMYARYINNRLNEWSSAIIGFKSLYGGLPGDSSRPAYTNSSGQAIGDNDGRVEREDEENKKFFKDLYVESLASEPVIRVRGRVMDFYWIDFSKNGTVANPGNFMKLPNINVDEALAFDHMYDDGNRSSGSVLFFSNPDGSVDLFVLFNPY